MMRKIGSMGATLCLMSALAATPGCETGPPGASESATESDTGDSQTDSETEGEPVVGWFDVGFGEFDFTPVEDGGEMRIVWGGQGAAMFPMPIRAGEFELPDDPGDYTDDKAPILDFTIDIDGYNDGVGGHFKRIANYPLAFDILPDGTYEFVYVRVIVPDDIDPSELEGKTAHLMVQLDPWGSAPLVQELDLTVRVDPPPF